VKAWVAGLARESSNTGSDRFAECREVSSMWRREELDPGALALHHGTGKLLALNDLAQLGATRARFGAVAINVEAIAICNSSCTICHRSPKRKSPLP
jgi:hypothetical protein